MGEHGPFGSLDDLSPDELRQRIVSLQALIERAPVPIAIAHDRECRFVSANRALAELVGVPFEANVSMTPAAGTPPYRIQRNGRDIPIDELPMQYAIAHRTVVRNEIEIVRADGRVVSVQNDVEPLYDTLGQVYGCVSVCVDLTERRHAELLLHEAARTKDEFLATLSHELRNPVAPIRTAVEVMRLARGNAELVEKARATVERQLLHLVRITDDLLDVTRITQNKVALKRERIDLRSALQSAIEATEPLIEAHGQKLVVHMPGTPVWMDADGTRLSQTFSNLLNNAAKYTDRGGEIQVVAEVSGDSATIKFSDTGLGIPPAMLPRIFEMFTQLHARTDASQGGLGVGLALAKRLVELHGGSIAATSEGLGRGSTFTVRLPVVSAADAHGGRPGHPQAHVAGGCKVLVAEDNEDAAEMMRTMLAFKGYDIRIAHDGAEAVEIALAFEPHIAFLDIGMPRMDGYEAARQIRAALGDRVTLVALTGWGQDEDKRKARDAGFDHHLTKPPEPAVLDQLVSDCDRTRTMTS